MTKSTATLSMDRIRRVSIDKPIRYRGWKIWSWTGWKGQKGKARYKSECLKCGLSIVKNQPIFIDQGRESVHWTCEYPDNRSDRLVGQWLAERSGIYLYVNVGGPNNAMGEYQRGGCFEIGTEPLVTERTDERTKNKMVRDGLERMYKLIDYREDAENECIVRE